MPIPFTCPRCGNQTMVADQYAGQTGPCSRCGQMVTVPLAGGMPAPPYPPPAKSSGSGVMIAVIIIVVVVLIVPLVFLLVCGGVMAALTLPAVSSAREAAQRSQCQNNLKQIGLAMHNYHDAYKCFPPAVITDDTGRPMQSWRTAILPFMEQQSLFDQYDSNEPWDSPKNRPLGDVAIPAYHCPDDTSPPTQTSYVMIVVPQGTGQPLSIGNEPNRVTKAADVKDGLSNTILVVEVCDSGIAWSEPRDMTLDELRAGVNAPGANGIRSHHPGGACVLLADGSVRFLSETMDMELLRILAEMNDGQAVPSEY